MGTADMTKVLQQQKLAAIEADLVSAAAHGKAYLHAEIFKKLGQLIKEPEDLEAVLGGLIDASERKIAGQEGRPLLSPGVVRTVALGALLAAPLTAAGKFLWNKYQKEQGWSNLSAKAPELVGQNPERAKMMYDLLHDTSPNIATNTSPAADLMKQMMAMPQLDIGTVKGLSDVSRNFSAGRGGAESAITDALKTVPAVAAGYQVLHSGKLSSAQVKANHVSKDGMPCILDWSTEAAKQAGITDAFSGSGLPVEQANNAFNMNQQEMGNTLLPLDMIVKELMSKEMELTQRAEMLAMQEQQVRQAMQAVQQLQPGYQEQTGVNPQTGEVAEQAPEQAPEQVPKQAPETPAPGQEVDQTGEGSMAQPGDTQADVDNNPVPAEEAQTQAQQMGGANFEEAQGNTVSADNKEETGDKTEDTGDTDNTGDTTDEEQDAAHGAEQPPTILPMATTPEDEQTASEMTQEQAQPMPPAQDNPAGGETDDVEEKETNGDDAVPAESTGDTGTGTETSGATSGATPGTETPDTRAQDAGDTGASPAESDGTKDTKSEDGGEDNGEAGGEAGEDSKATGDTSDTGTDEVPGTGEAAPTEGGEAGDKGTEPDTEGAVSEQAGVGSDQAGAPVQVTELTEPAPTIAPMPAEAAQAENTRVINVPINLPLQISVKLAEDEGLAKKRAEALESIQVAMTNLFRPE